MWRSIFDFRKHFIFSFCLAPLVLFSQIEVITDTSCYVDRHKIDTSGNFDWINHYNSLVENLTSQELKDYLDCLLEIYPNEPTLYFIKAISCDVSSESIDTSCCRYYRNCIDMGYEKGISYYNMGALYLNYLSMGEYIFNNNWPIRILSIEAQLKILKQAENYFWHSLENGEKDAYFVLGSFYDNRKELLQKDLDAVFYQADTLIIFSRICDCGEFGGHIETVHLIKEENIYIATYETDSIICHDWEPSNPIDYHQYNGMQIKIPSEILHRLIDRVLDYKENYDLLSNAPFRIAIVLDSTVVSKEIHINWPYYLEFREEVFGF